MNYRLLIRNLSPRDDPDRVAALNALAAVMPESFEDLDARLESVTPWLLDLPTQAECERLGRWVEASSSLRVSVVPSVKSGVSSRAAAITWLEQRLGAAIETSPGEAMETQRRRHEAARAKAEALAAREDEPPPGMPRRRMASPRRATDPELNGAAIRARGTGSGRGRPSLEEIPPIHSRLDLEQERTPWGRIGLGVLVMGAVIYLLIGRATAPLASGDLERSIQVALSERSGFRVVDAATVRARAVQGIRGQGFDPDRFKVLVFIDRDAEAVKVEATAGYPERAPASGVRVRVRVRGRGEVGGRETSIGTSVDTVLDWPKLPFEAYHADGVLLEEE